MEKMTVFKHCPKPFRYHSIPQETMKKEILFIDVLSWITIGMTILYFGWQIYRAYGG